MFSFQTKTCSFVFRDKKMTITQFSGTKIVGTVSFGTADLLRLVKQVQYKLEAK